MPQTDINYWLGQETYPWKSEGFGGGRVGYDAWAAAGFPNIANYPGGGGTGAGAGAGGGVGVVPTPPSPTLLPTDFPPDFPTPGPIGPYAPPEPSFPPEWAGTLEKFGYTDPMGMNAWEQEALKFIEEIYGTKLPLETMAPAADIYGRIIRGEFAPDISGATEPAGEFYKSLLAGEYGPEGEAYRRDVYESTKTGAMQSLEDMQQQMAESFAQRGGYFGGHHAMAQSMLGERVGTSLNEILANLNLTGYQQNLANMLTAGAGMTDIGALGLGATGQDISARMGAAGGLTGLAGQQQGVTDAILGNLLTGGQMISQREMVNRSELQNAMQRAYQDWNRARSETMMPFQMGMGLLGFQPQQPIVQQPQESPWGQLLGGIGTGASSAAMTALLASSKKFKKDISEISEEDEDVIFDKIKKTPIFNYRYKFEPETQKLHMGLITEYAPEEVTFFEKKMVGLYEYIATLHAAIKVLSRKIEAFKNGG